MGRGSVVVPGGGSCDADCMYKLPVGSTVSATAMDAGSHAFQMWTTPNCAGQSRVCTFTLATAQTLGAMFE